ncbi:MAG TPA: hypothetical protein VIM70_11230 [Clostridium sp.]|uniref:hypothetical protein n=1 Tax=Clostridium sp. TaxID=1506 RepID=UPI002F95E062
MNYFENVETSLIEICEECKYYKTNQCVSSTCNIGFALNAIRGAKINGGKTINDGTKLIPTTDIKFYEKNAIAKGIASVCRLCKGCRENHNENCIVSLSRRSLEITYLKQEVVYPGNVLMYLVNLAKQDSNFADKIKTEYTHMRII